jgi:outer membrane murein-binding lipoprotein Lpp
MDIDELLAKEEVKKALGVDGVAAISGLATQSGTLKAQMDELTSKVGSITDQKTRAKAEAEELRAKLEEIENGKLSSKDKLAKEMETLQKAREKAEEDVAGMRKQMDERERDLKLAKIAAQVEFLDIVPPEMRELAVKTRFNGIDLGNENLVQASLLNFRAEHKGLLKADGGGNGTGTKPGDANANAKRTPAELSVETIKGMDSKSFSENKDALWAAAAAEQAALDAQ